MLSTLVGGAFSMATPVYKQDTGGIFLASFPLSYHHMRAPPPPPPTPPRLHHFRIRSCVSVKCASRANTYLQYILFIRMYLCKQYLRIYRVVFNSEANLG